MDRGECDGPAQAHADDDSTVGKDLKPSSVVLERLGIKLNQYEMIFNQVSGWVDELSDTLNFN